MSSGERSVVSSVRCRDLIVVMVTELLHPMGASNQMKPHLSSWTMTSHSRWWRHVTCHAHVVSSTARCFLSVEGVPSTPTYTTLSSVLSWFVMLDDWWNCLEQPENQWVGGRGTSAAFGLLNDSFGLAKSSCCWSSIWGAGLGRGFLFGDFLDFVSNTLFSIGWCWVLDKVVLYCNCRLAGLHFWGVPRCELIFLLGEFLLHWLSFCFDGLCFVGLDLDWCRSPTDCPAVVISFSELEFEFRGLNFFRGFIAEELEARNIFG